MINRLRIKLTLWFVLLTMAAYSFDGILGMWRFDNRMQAFVEQDLTHMCNDVAPAVEYQNGKPSLLKWAQTAAKQHISLHETTQLFDAKKNLVEAYGPTGINHLYKGRDKCIVDGQRISAYSNYIELFEGGFLQIQTSSEAQEQAMLDIVISKLIRCLIMCIVIGLVGWFYSAKAVEPVVRSFKILRTFVDDAGHELNTPVALIENSIETIESYLNEHKLPTDVLRIIQRASGSLKSLSQNLLLLAKMEQPSVDLRFMPLSLNDLVTDVAHDLRDKAQWKDIDLQISDVPEVNVAADERVLSRAFSNLIENAIRYTPAGGQIKIYGFRQENNICLAIRDTGCGIPAKSLPNIFERFYRVDKARSKIEGGYGLGLAIVKAIIETHKGSIRVESNEGKGSTFFVTLPIASA